MRINWIGYYDERDGYGRFSSRLVAALQRAGCDVTPLTSAQINAPTWLHERWGVDWERLTISCLPPFMVQQLPGKCWLLSMTEGSRIPDKWAHAIADSGVERVLVPCAHNAAAFRDSGVTVPISVVPGGTDPAEFPVLDADRDIGKPYTFLTFADRGQRKGWMEVWDAFYLAFGGKTTGVQDVRLIVKARAKSNTLANELIKHGTGLDRRIIYQVDDAADMATVYAQADCLVLPSRSEGWGMPHREAAMMGLPVITQAYSDLADAGKWALTVDGGHMETIPQEDETCLGEWMVADKRQVATRMRQCYDKPWAARQLGLRGAAWLRDNQTWQHAAAVLVELIESELRPNAAEAMPLDRSYV